MFVWPCHVFEYVMQELLVNTNNHKHKPLLFGICMPTGVAAISIGCITSHIFFAIGFGTGLISSLKKKLKNKEATNHINETFLLIIDECPCSCPI